MSSSLPTTKASPSSSSPFTTTTTTPSPTKDRKRTFVNSVTGEEMTITAFASETGGRSTKARVVCQPGGGPGPHWHRSYTEHFTAVRGALTLQRDGVETTLVPGQGDASSALVERGVMHLFRNDTAEPIELDVELKPGQPGFEKGLVVFYGLAEDGLADKESGFPASIVYAALGSKHIDVWFPGVSGALLNAANGILATYARWSGIEKQLVDKYYYGAGFID